MKKTISILAIFCILLSCFSALAEGWICPACANNASGNFCNNCGNARPVFEEIVWNCYACGANATGNFCSNCGTVRLDGAADVGANSPDAAIAQNEASTEVPPLEFKFSEDVADIVQTAIAHTVEPTQPSPDKYTYYIEDYIGQNLSDVGYTSIGGDRLCRYGSATIELCIVTPDGSYVDIDDEDDLEKYIVVGQSIAPNTVLKLAYQKDSKGKEYSNLIDYASIESVDLYVARLDGTISGDITSHVPVAIKANPDRYTCYVRDYVGKNLATVGYTSLGGDRLDEYLAARIELCIVTTDGTYIDIEDEDLLKQYVIIGQNIEPNTQVTLQYQKDSKGKEYDNLIDFQSVELIDLLVARVDGLTFNDPVAYEPVPVTASPSKYTRYIRNYVGKNLASFGYTSMGGERLDEYGDARLKLSLLTPDRSALDVEETEQLAGYIVVAQDLQPNTELKLTYQKDSKGKEYSSLVDSVNYKKITLTLAKVNTIPAPEVEEKPIADSSEPATTAAPAQGNYTGETHTYRDFTYVLQSDDTAVITGYKGKDSDVSISSEIDGHEVVGIGVSAFEGHTEIKEIYIWADLTFIDDRAFMGCTKLKEVSVPSEAERLGNSAFEGCTSLTEAYLWGDPSIGNRAFFGCTKLKEISIGSDTEMIGESAFEGCTSLKDVYIWGGTPIGKAAFRGCTSLKEISIDSDCETIGDYAFYGCTSLKEATIWGSDTKIGVEAFGNCPKVEINQW